MFIEISDFLSNENEKFHEYNGSIQLEFDDSQIKLKEDPIYNLFISKFEDEIFLDLDIDYTYEKPCDRCLENSIKSEHVSYTAKVVRNLNEEIEDEEFDLIQYNEKKQIDLSQLIKELIILSIPMKTLCEDECKGICPKCGANLNLSECNCDNDEIDIRFASLKGMFDHEEV